MVDPFHPFLEVPICYPCPCNCLGKRFDILISNAFLSQWSVREKLDKFGARHFWFCRFTVTWTDALIDHSCNRLSSIITTERVCPFACLVMI